VVPEASTRPRATAQAVRSEGTLKVWHDDRGFGFIQPSQGGADVFIHIKAFPAGAGRPQVGQRLFYAVEAGPQGKPRAANVVLPRAARPASRGAATGPQARAPWGATTLVVLPAFFIVFLVVAALWRPPAWVAGLYLVASVVSFLAYAVDKSAARGGGRRTPEGTLHGLALLGGWPGALLAQQVLRHKSSKASFRQAFWATVGLNVLGFVLACSPLGQAWWRLV